VHWGSGTLPQPFETCRRGDSDATFREADEYFARRGELRRTLGRFATALDAAGIPYAVIGAMALFEHGHERFTTDVDVIVTAEARRQIHALLVGNGFLPPFAESRNLRDTDNGVRIDLLLAGDFPGDGKPKPVAFPDPSVEPLCVKDGIRYVTAEKLVELKLASGISHQLRYRDLGDVVSLIDSARLPREFGDRLNPYVQPKWFEIWDAWSVDPMRDRY
jgi:hypothetical protein